MILLAFALFLAVVGIALGLGVRITLGSRGPVYVEKRRSR